MFSLICVWIIGWVNNREAGDLKRHRAHYDVIVVINLDVVVPLNASRRSGFVCNWLKQLIHRYLCIHVRSSEVCHQTLVAYLLPTWTSAWITRWYHLYFISGYRLRIIAMYWWGISCCITYWHCTVKCGTVKPVFNDHLMGYFFAFWSNFCLLELI